MSLCLFYVIIRSYYFITTVLSLETAQGRIRVQNYSKFWTMEKELKRICASEVKICSIEVKMCRKISNFVPAIYNKVIFMADKTEKMSTGHVSVPNSSVQPTK